MKDKYLLTEKNLIPLSKYWSVRLGFLDILNGTGLFIPQIKKRKDLGDDLKVMVRIAGEWKTGKEHNVGEAGALFRLLQFASWKFSLNKKFIKEKTLKTRNITNNPGIVDWPLAKLLELDDQTPQWASAAILTGSREKAPDNFFLNLSKEALRHYEKCRKEGKNCAPRFDSTILAQATAFLDMMKKGKTPWKPEQQDDYCFARAFDFIDKKKGNERWPELKGHESNRLEEMEKQIDNLKKGRTIDSKDHRVVQAITLLALKKGLSAKFKYPKCVSKSWPQFWDFLEYVIFGE